MHPYVLEEKERTVKGEQDTTANTSSNPAFAVMLGQQWSRRQVVWGGLMAAGVTLADGTGLARFGRRAEANAPLFGFQSIPVSKADQIVVPPGYTAQVFFAWGDPISDGPAFKPDASNTADEQALQAGMHHDAIHFFPLPMGSDSATRGLLAMNHEYTDDGLLHVGGMEPWTAEKVAKAQAAHGVSIIEVAFEGNAWKVVRPSQYARRITSRTPMRFSGPAAGQARRVGHPGHGGGKAQEADGDGGDRAAVGAPGGGLEVLAGHQGERAEDALLDGMGAVDVAARRPALMDRRRQCPSLRPLGGRPHHRPRAGDPRHEHSGHNLHVVTARPGPSLPLPHPRY
jgi:hypothetical protein